MHRTVKGRCSECSACASCAVPAARTGLNTAQLHAHRYTYTHKLQGKPRAGEARCVCFLREINSSPPSEDPAKSPPMVKNMPNMNVFLSRWLDTCLFQSTCHVWPLDRCLNHEHVQRFVRALMAGPLLCADVVFACMRHLSLQDPPAAQCLLLARCGAELCTCR